MVPSHDQGKQSGDQIMTIVHIWPFKAPVANGEPKTVCDATILIHKSKSRLRFLIQRANFETSHMVFSSHMVFMKKMVCDVGTITHGFEQKIMCDAQKIIFFVMCLFFVERCKLSCQTTLTK
jgi:hypothetical protein